MVNNLLPKGMILLSVLISICFADENPQCSLAEYFYKQGNYRAAIIEYKRYLFFEKTDTSREQIYYNIGRAYKENREYDKAVTYIQYASDASQDKRTQDNYTIEISLILIKSGNFDLAKLKLLKIIHFSVHEDLRLKANYFLGLSFVMENNWQASHKHLGNYFSQTDPAVYTKLDSLFRLRDSYAYKSPKLAKWLSTFIPGSGQIYAKDFRHGFNALGVNVLFGYLVYYGLSEGQILDVLIVYLTLFDRYYRGNRYHAERIAREYNQSIDKRFRKQVTDLLYQQVK